LVNVTTAVHANLLKRIRAGHEGHPDGNIMGIKASEEAVRAHWSLTAAH
jgi:hypothetical protein